jgi:hypothetical protein
MICSRYAGSNQMVYTVSIVSLSMLQTMKSIKSHISMLGFNFVIRVLIKLDG